MNHLSRASRENHQFALKLMVTDLGTDWLYRGTFTSVGRDYETVLPTTWAELTALGYLTATKMAHSATRYALTNSGWVAGAALLGVPDKPAFQESLGKLSEALKANRQGKTQAGLETIESVARQSRLPVGFIRNAIDCDFLGVYLKQTGATWESAASRGIMVRIPTTCGLKN
jgi:hypothetical protein